MRASDVRKRGQWGRAGQRGASFPISSEKLRLKHLALLCAAGFAAAMISAPGAGAQQAQQTVAISEPAAQTPAPGEASSKSAGNYTIQETIEAGYRDSMIGGNINNYDTFENLGSGVRLFDYSLDMRSADHRGIFFDNLSFSNFGYGGDPNDVSRLHVDKNKWFDFRGMFRRDKNFWNYNLLANPLNPTSTVPGAAISSSPQAMDLSHEMQDYDLTLFPQSRVRFRLGYSRNVNSGPAAETIEGGTEPLLAEKVSDITNSYRMGVDYRGLARTTLSFDELLTYTAINNSATENNLLFQLANGTPVDLGLVFVGTAPCAAPITNATTTPPTVTSNCNGYLSYSQVQNPRSTFPVERASFQSTYFKNLAMSGSGSYSNGNNTVTGFNEAINGWASRTVTRGGTTAGPARANRVSANATWSGDYRLTDKLSLFDQFTYENWRIPSMWATAETNLFAVPALPGQTGLTLPISAVTPATYATVCPTAPYNGAGCPQHNASSGADVTNEITSRFLGQDMKSNTFEVKYDLTRRINAYVGYAYSARAIEDFSATFDTGEIYFPGGTGGNVANHFFAARADCAAVAGVLPAGCTVNANGSIQEGTPTNLLAEAGNDAARNVYDIHENAGTLGVYARPMDSLRINADVMLGYNDNSFTRASPRQLQSYKVHLRYAPRPWANVDAAVDIHENRDNVATVNNLEHGRAYSFAATLARGSRLWANLGYNYMNVFSQTEICFPDTGSTIFTTVCPIVGASSPLGTLSYYSSQDHYAYGDLMVKPIKRVTAMVGYGGSIVRGNTTFLNPMTPTGTLDFNYVKPFASLAFDICKGLSYKTAWNYYGYNGRGVPNRPGLAAIPSQDFNGSNVTFSMRYAF